MNFSCNIGVSSEERRKKQKILIDAELFLNPTYVKNLGETIDYRRVYNLIEKMAEKEYKLIESLAQDIADEILKNFKVKEILIRVKKPSALKKASYAAVEIRKKKIG